MSAKLKSFARTSQFALLVLFAGTWIVFGIINPSIFSLANFFSLTRASIVPALFSLALMLIMVLGSFDFSFTMVGAFASYCSIFIITELGLPQTPLIVLLLISIAIAVLLEIFNWFLIDKFKLQPFITTLGTHSMLKGMILAFVSTSFIYTLPDSLRKLSTNYLMKASFADGTEAVLHIGILAVVIMYALVHILLQYTSFGRKVYAIGANEEAARRVGINVSKVRFITFCLAGVILGIGGIIHDSLARCTVPLPPDLIGQELTFIAAVTLGCGANLQARGSVIGTFIAVFFLRFVSTNLIMLGIPSYWQRVVTGGILLVSLLAQVSGKRDPKVGKE